MHELNQTLFQSFVYDEDRARQIPVGPRMIQPHAGNFHEALQKAIVGGRIHGWTDPSLMAIETDHEAAAAAEKQRLKDDMEWQRVLDPNPRRIRTANRSN